MINKLSTYILWISFSVQCMLTTYYWCGNGGWFKYGMIRSTGNKYYVQLCNNTIILCFLDYIPSDTLSVCTGFDYHSPIKHTRRQHCISKMSSQYQLVQLHQYYPGYRAKYLSSSCLGDGRQVFDPQKEKVIRCSTIW